MPSTKKAIGARIKFPGSNVVEPSYLKVKFFKVGARILLDYLDIRLEDDGKIIRYRPIVTGTMSGDYQVEMRRIEGGGEISLEETK